MADVFAMARGIVGNLAQPLFQKGLSAVPEEVERETPMWWACAATYVIHQLLGDQTTNLLRGFMFDFEIKPEEGLGESRRVEVAVGDFPPILLGTIPADEVTEFTLDGIEDGDGPTHYAILYYPIRVRDSQRKPSDDIVKVKPSALILPGSA